MRRPRLRSVVARPVVAGLVGQYWTPSPSSSPGQLAPEPTGRLVRSGSRCFSEEEEELLIRLHALLGNRWPLIAGRLPGRTDKEVESHWNSKMRRKLRRAGVDPDNRRSVTALFAPADDDGQQRRRRPTECPAKHPNRRLSSNDDCVSDAGSYCRAQQQQELAHGLNLELTLSTPCLYFVEKEQVTGH